MAYIYSVHINNPSAVWHELKNARAVLGPEGQQWNSGGWYDTDRRFGGAGYYTMCLANVLRFVGLGKKDAPGSYSRSTYAARTDAESLVLQIIRQRYGSYNDIPAFNDSRVKDGSQRARIKAFKQIARVLDEAIQAVQPYAFQHTVSIADEVMTDEERKQINAALAEDMLSQQLKRAQRWWHRFFARVRESEKYPQMPPRVEMQAELKKRVAKLMEKNDSPEVREFRDWLNSFEERGWDAFWEELADCDSEDCEKIRTLVGI